MNTTIFYPGAVIGEIIPTVRPAAAWVITSLNGEMAGLTEVPINCQRLGCWHIEEKIAERKESIKNARR